jgi:hypothetical protein
MAIDDESPELRKTQLTSSRLEEIVFRTEIKLQSRAAFRE